MMGTTEDIREQLDVITRAVEAVRAVLGADPAPDPAPGPSLAELLVTEALQTRVPRNAGAPAL